MLRVAVLSAVLVAALAATRPNIPEIFIGAVDVESHDRRDGNKVIYGEGYIAHNQKENKGAEEYDLHPEKYHNFHVLTLQRGDLNKEFQLSSEDRRDCHSRDIATTLVPPFAWVANATFRGTVKHHEVELDAWEATFGGVRLLIGVAHEDANRPVVFERESIGEFTRFFFREFNATRPDDKDFEVPSECHATAGLSDPSRPVIPEVFSSVIEGIKLRSCDVAFSFLSQLNVTIAPAPFSAKDSGDTTRMSRRPLSTTTSIHLSTSSTSLTLSAEISTTLTACPPRTGTDLASFSFLTTLIDFFSRDCQVYNLTRRLEAPFAWVKDAEFRGTVKHHEVVLDAWEGRFGGVRLLVGVEHHDPNRPVILERESTGDLTRYFFREFNTTRPDEREFEVPQECNK